MKTTPMAEVFGRNWPGKALAIVIAGAAFVQFMVWIGTVENDPASQSSFAIQRRGCDQAFRDLMESTDPAVVNRAGWIMEEMNCSFSRRFITRQREQLQAGKTK